MDWKKTLLIGVGWGLATAFGVAALFGGYSWYKTRPKPAKPWNTSAIKAKYANVSVEGDDNSYVFYYTLENETDFDYRLEDENRLALNARMSDRTLVSFSKYMSLDYPIYVPAKRRVRLALHFKLHFPNPRPKSDDGVLEKYLNDKMANLNGFDFLDETTRYEIVLPAGWRHSKEAER